MPRQYNTRTGQLDQQVTLYRGSKVSDGMGGATQTLVAYASGIWAKIEPISGDERTEAQRTEARRKYRVTIRYRAGVREADVVEWAGRRLNIRFIETWGGRELYTRLDCEMGARI